jgi:hypothetical protein
MFHSAQLVHFSGVCDVCGVRLATTATAEASLTSAAQDAVLDHVKRAHRDLFEHLPVFILGQLVASSAQSFSTTERSPMTLQLA